MAVTSPDTPMIIPAKAQAGLLQFYKANANLQLQHWNIKQQMREIDLLYMREHDWTLANQRAKIANRYGDSSKLQNITVPVVMPQVENGVTYLASVFLTGNPLFGVVSSPEYEDAALQMESLIDQQATYGGWVRELMMFFRDGLKYNLAALEVTWNTEVTYAIESDVTYSPIEGKQKQVIWAGNCIRRHDPYNILFDTRVDPVDIPSKGEFAGYVELMGRVALKQFLARLPSRMNVTSAFESGVGGGGNSATYYIPQLNPDALLNRNLRATTNWLTWAGLESSDGTPRINYKGIYEVTTLYARIIPSDFGLRVPSDNTPQVFKLIIVNGSVLVYAERQTNAHQLLPMLFSQPLEDGLAYQTKSFGSNVAPIQSVTSGMLNSVIAARRRAISDRTVYDPSRINESDINSDNPSAKIPVRPAAYGKNVAEAVYAFPYRDDQSPQILQEIGAFNSWANIITGQNQAQQGQFVKGNKTLHEYADVMQHASGRSQMMAMLQETQIFTPLKMILKVNILQYQTATSVYSKAANKEVTIDPVALRQAVMDFQVSDGLIPTDKLINSDAFTVAMQAFSTSPMIASAYNVAPMFSYLLKTQGANVKPFEKSAAQVAFEQAMGQWQQQVNNLAANMKNMAPGDIQKSLAALPQPKPADFGYNPQAPSQPTNVVKPSILDQVLAVAGQTAGQSQGQGQQQPSQQQPPTQGNQNA